MIKYNRELVIEKVRQCFPDENQDTVLSLLDDYGTETHERECERVQIAILKLSNGNSEKLLELLQMAKRDYRDVLAYAEYPEEITSPAFGNTDKKEIKLIRERDRLQYVQWLQRKN